MLPCQHGLYPSLRETAVAFCRGRRIAAAAEEREQEKQTYHQTLLCLSL